MQNTTHRKRKILKISIKQKYKSYNNEKTSGTSIPKKN